MIKTDLHGREGFLSTSCFFFLLHNYKVRGFFTTLSENHIFQALLQRSVVLSSSKGDVSALNKVECIILQTYKEISKSPNYIILLT